MDKLFDSNASCGIQKMGLIESNKYFFQCENTIQIN